MTNNEAKATLEFFRDNILNNLWFPNKLRKRLPEALDLAIKALEDVERLEDENHRNFVNSQHIISSLIEEIKKRNEEKPQGDLISRKELKEAIRKRLCISSLKYLTEQEKVIVEEIDNATGHNWKFYYDHGYKQAKRDLKRTEGGAE